MSTFALEVLRLGQQRLWSVAITYVLLTVAGSIGAVLAGLVVARRLTTL